MKCIDCRFAREPVYEPYGKTHVGCAKHEDPKLAPDAEFKSWFYSQLLPGDRNTSGYLKGAWCKGLFVTHSGTCNNFEGKE